MAVIQDIPAYSGIGIYALVDDQGKMYIGSSKNVSHRIKQHDKAIRDNAAARKIQEAVAEGRTFRCELIEKLDYGISTYDLLEREQFYVDKFDTAKSGYNALPHPSDQNRRKLREANLRHGNSSATHKKLLAPILKPTQAPPPSGSSGKVVYKIKVLDALKEKGFSTYKLRQEKLLGESVIQQIRRGELVSWPNMTRLCQLLQCQPGDILEFTESQADL